MFGNVVCVCTIFGSQAIADQNCLGAKYGIGSATPFTHDNHPYHMCMVLPTLAHFVSLQNDARVWEDKSIGLI